MKTFGPITYLIARGRPESAHDWNQPYITYTPPAAEGDLHWIGSYDDHTPHSAGGECEPQHILSRPGLTNMIEQVGGAWFLPYVRRMAREENVTLDEIAAAYQQHNNSPIESKRFGPRLFPCEQAAYDWAVANPQLQRCLIELIGSAVNLADENWLEWQRSTARYAHRYITVHFLEGQPAPTMHPANVFRALTICCVQAARAAEREGVATPATRLAALKAPGIIGRGHASYQTLFPGLT